MLSSRIELQEVNMLEIGILVGCLAVVIVVMMIVRGEEE
jgi:hypothetical protein